MKSDLLVPNRQVVFLPSRHGWNAENALQGLMTIQSKEFWKAIQQKDFGAMMVCVTKDNDDEVESERGREIGNLLDCPLQRRDANVLQEPVLE